MSMEKTDFTDKQQIRKQLRKNIRIYNRKKGNLQSRLEKEFLDHGIATIPCRVDGIGDLLSPYSVKGYESLNESFVSYLNSIADLIPEPYPIVLSVVGCQFTEEEQQIVRSTVEDDFAYALGAVEKENRRQTIRFVCMTGGLILTSLLISLFDWWGTLALEFLFVFFWFFADVFVDYLLLEGKQLRKQRLKAARMACISVEFSDEYDERDYSEDETKAFFEGMGCPLKRTQD